jgi:hypothetical protein
MAALLLQCSHFFAGKKSQAAHVHAGITPLEQACSLLLMIITKVSFSSADQLEYFPLEQACSLLLMFITKGAFS